jgi:hypothetical protein
VHAHKFTSKTFWPFFWPDRWIDMNTLWTFANKSQRRRTQRRKIYFVYQPLLRTCSLSKETAWLRIPFDYFLLTLHLTKTDRGSMGYGFSSTQWYRAADLENKFEVGTTGGAKLDNGRFSREKRPFFVCTQRVI